MNNSHRFRFVNAATAGCMVLIGLSARADDWPQFHGPKRDAVWRESGIIEKFPTRRLKPVWKTRIAGGYSGPTVADGRVYVTDRLVKPKQIERVHCFDAATGEKIWSHEYDCRYNFTIGDAGPQACVTVDDGRAYALGSMADFFCFNAESGNILWQKDFGGEYNAKVPAFGVASAPLIEGDLVIMQIGGKDACVAAFDKRTGEERWTALEDPASYSAPIVIDQAGERVLVVYTGDNVVGLDVKTGKVYWEHEAPYKTNFTFNSVSPVVHENRLLVSSMRGGSLLLQLSQDKADQPTAEKLWAIGGQGTVNTRGLHSLWCTPIIEEGFIYGVCSRGELRCLNLESGERVWESLKLINKRGKWASAHFVRHEDEVWVLSEKGELIIAKFTPEGYEEISRAKLINPTRLQYNQRGGVVWAPPAFANKHVFVRSDNKLIAVNLAADNSREDAPQDGRITLADD